MRFSILIVGLLLIICSFFAVTNTFGQQAIDEAAWSQSQKERIQELIRTGKNGEAEKAIIKALQSNPDNLDAILLRRALGTSYLRTGSRVKGERQLEQILNYVVRNPAKGRPLLKYMPQLILSISAIQQGQEPKASQILDSLIPLFKKANEEEAANIGYSNGLSSLIGLKARLLARKNLWNDATSLYESELDRLRTRWRDDIENPDNWLRLCYMLRSATETIGNDNNYNVQPLDFERQNLLKAAAIKFPDSSKIIKEDFQDRLRRIDQYKAESPQAAAKLYKSLTKELKTAVDNTKFKKPLLRLRVDVEKAAQAHRRGLKKKAMIGTPIQIPAGPWLGTANLNPDEMNYGLAALLFFSAAKQDSLTALVQANDFFKTVHPDVKLAMFTHDLDDSFSRISIVNRNKSVTEENKTKYRQSLVEKIIEPNSIEYPLAIVDDAVIAGEAFGVDAVPMVVLFKNGQCTDVVQGQDFIKKLSLSLNQLKNKSRN